VALKWRGTRGNERETATNTEVTSRFSFGGLSVLVFDVLVLYPSLQSCRCPCCCGRSSLLSAICNIYDTDFTLTSESSPRTSGNTP